MRQTADERIAAFECLPIGGGEIKSRAMYESPSAMFDAKDLPPPTAGASARLTAIHRILTGYQ